MTTPARTDGAAEAADRALDALARVTCCPYGKCQQSRVNFHGTCRSHLYLASAKAKLEGLERMGFDLKERANAKA